MQRELGHLVSNGSAVRAAATVHADPFAATSVISNSPPTLAAMKNYQLMGRKKVLDLRKRTVYPNAHLLLMPLEILTLILSYVLNDVSALLLVALSCTKLNNIVNKFFIYNLIVFRNTAQFVRFAHAHLPQRTSLRRFSSSEPSAKINYIRSLHFKNPPTASSLNSLAKIAGTYEVDTLGTVPLDYQSFVTNLRTLLNEAYGLKEVLISEIAPQFEFSGDLLQPSSSSLRYRFKSPKPARSLDKLVLSAQSGWNIPFKAVHIALFVNIYDEISELRLNNFVISEVKLVSDGPCKPVSIKSLAVSACIYTDAKRSLKKCPSILAGTSSLTLDDIQHGVDLSLIDVIKVNDRLSRLSIDISSSVFYYTDLLEKKFNFTKYNNFFKLVCSGQAKYGKLKEVVLTNFDLFHSFSHQHDKLNVIEEEEDDWIEPPTNTFEYFLKYLSQIPLLTIVVKEAPKVTHTCVHCGFSVEEKAKSITSLLPHEWGIILAPILVNKQCSVVIYDHSLRTLFSRRAHD